MFVVVVVFFDGALDVGVGKHVGPERGDLMGVVDLHNVELLYDLGVYTNFFHLKDWYNLFAKIDRDQVVERSQGLNFLISL